MTAMATWPPVSSEEARELRELEAEQPDELVDQAEAADPGVHVCDDGWRGEDDQGRPIPCLRCRPYLAAHRARCTTCDSRADRCRSRQVQLRGRCCPDCDHQPNPSEETR